jgi:hypothetical protein
MALNTDEPISRVISTGALLLVLTAIGIQLLPTEDSQQPWQTLSKGLGVGSDLDHGHWAKLVSVIANSCSTGDSCSGQEVAVAPGAFGGVRGLKVSHGHAAAVATLLA